MRFNSRMKFWELPGGLQTISETKKLGCAMKFRMLTIITMVSLSFSAAAFGADIAIDGRWTGRYSGGQGGPMDMDYMFKAYGSYLTGTTIGGSNGERTPILNGKIDGKKVSFTVLLYAVMTGPTQFTVQQMKFDYTGDISGDNLKLKFVINGDRNNGGSFTVKREKEKKGAPGSTPLDFDYESERLRAFEMFNAQNLIGARPILEKLYNANPDDAEALEILALTTMTAIIEESNPANHNAILLQTRAMGLRAREMGRNSTLLLTLIEQICDDGSIKAPAAAVAAAAKAKTSPATEALMEAETAFHSGKIELAIEHYQSAAQLDPNLYEVPLFTGDAYFALNQKEKAYEQYARAVAIDPYRETAYRYWGNVLMSENRFDEAKEKLIESVIADPYSRLPWQFISNWATRSNNQAGHPRVDMLESAARKEKRNSLAEEYQTLSAAAEGIKAQLEKGGVRESDLDESQTNLLNLHRDGLLEAYIFLARPDENIAREYPEYRKNNYDKLRRYMNEHVVSKRGN